MSYRVTTCEALQTNLSAAGTTLMLCRANISHIALSEEGKADTLWRIERQVAELEGMRLELTRPVTHKKCTRPSGSHVCGQLTDPDPIY